MLGKILFVSPNKDFSGYAHAARDYIRALDISGANMAIRSLIYDGGSFKLSERMKELESRSAQDIDIIIQMTTPNETERKEGVFNVNIFCWETDRIPKEWVDQLNKMDLVIVSCEENVRACRRSGVVVPVEKVHFTTNLDRFKKKPEPFDVPNMSGRFKFLTVCQYSKKKGIDALLKAYLTEFTPEDNVMLILKTYMGPNDGPAEREKIMGIINSMKTILRLGQYPPIQLIHEVMSDEDIDRLYGTADCYVLPSRGEGWSIPHFDALGFGLPAIAVNWGGPTEFITDDCGWLVDFNMSPVCNMMHPFPYLYTARENWAEPHVNDLRESMRNAFTLSQVDSPEWEDIKQAARDRVKDFAPEIIGPKLIKTIDKYYSKWKKANVS